MNRLIQLLFFGLVVKPLVLIVLGLNIRGKKFLPAKGPAVIVANHNSHLDTMVLMSLFPLFKMHKVRPVAAADYFLKNKFMAWFSLKIIGIIPLERSGTVDKSRLFDDCHEALNRQEILVLFPEGSRGEPDKMSALKKGVFHLIKDQAGVSVTPVVMHGLGYALPKGEGLLVPVNVDVIIGQPIGEHENAASFVNETAEVFNELKQHCITKQS
ncbi:lysophospholipid acyltransferase family protein [Marinicella meishanensis]|uniref:lysophospholipid acyltransferase family protein n=1 Tax=Marinicella meishanensis TaxID=2873263 RepID=UPI001CC13FDB|nr:lysophospholipid acyltransferase family protein [Marinicella sp. NBU2979]